MQLLNPLMWYEYERCFGTMFRQELCWNVAELNEDLHFIFLPILCICVKKRNILVNVIKKEMSVKIE